MDVLIASVTHVDNDNREHIQGETYLIINENNEHFVKQKTGHFSHGRTIEVFDMNADGLDDVYFADHGYEGGPHPYPGGQDQYWLQVENGSFENMTHILPDVLDYTHGSCQGNFIPDKKVLDLIVTGGSAKYQYNNHGIIFEQSERLSLLAKNMDGTHKGGLIDIPSMWCLALDLDGNDIDDIVFPGNINQDWWDENGKDISGKHFIAYNDGNGYFHEENVEYVDMPKIEYKQNVGHEFMHTTGMFEVQLDGDKCADFVVYNSNYGDYESFTTYTNTCGKDIEITNLFHQENEQLCEQIDLGNNQIVAWCGSTIYRPKLITFEKDNISIVELTKQDVYDVIEPADAIKLRHFFEL